MRISGESTGCCCHDEPIRQCLCVEADAPEMRNSARFTYSRNTSLMTMVAFIIKNLIDLDLARFVRQDHSSPMKKHTFIRFYHHDAHYYVIISHNASVPMIGHLKLAAGTPTSHASWAWLIKICP